MKRDGMWGQPRASNRHWGTLVIVGGRLGRRLLRGGAPARPAAVRYCVPEQARTGYPPPRPRELETRERPAAAGHQARNRPSSGSVKDSAPAWFGEKCAHRTTGHNDGWWRLREPVKSAYGVASDRASSTLDRTSPTGSWAWSGEATSTRATGTEAVPVMCPIEG